MAKITVFLFSISNQTFAFAVAKQWPTSWFGLSLRFRSIALWQANEYLSVHQPSLLA
jgi:hypothetical protein